MTQRKKEREQLRKKKQQLYQKMRELASARIKQQQLEELTKQEKPQWLAGEEYCRQLLKKDQKYLLELEQLEREELQQTGIEALRMQEKFQLNEDILSQEKKKYHFVKIIGLLFIGMIMLFNFGFLMNYWNNTISASASLSALDMLEEKIVFFATNYFEEKLSSLSNVLTGASLAVVPQLGGENVSKNDSTPSTEIQLITSAAKTPQEDLMTQDATNPPGIAFVNPTRASGNLSTDTMIPIYISLNNASDMKKFIWNWNGTNVTLYDNSTVLYLNFNNVSGLGESSTIAMDVSLKSGNSANINGATWNTSGKYGKCLNFDGANDLVTINNNQNINLTGKLSISMWVKANTGAQYDMAISKTTSTSWNDGYGIFLNSATEIRFFVTDYLANVASSTKFSTGRWIHVVGVYNGTNVLIYLNGTLGTTDSYTGVVKNTTAPLEIGRGRSDSFNWNGPIDEVIIFNRSLSTDEIQQLYMSNLYKYDTTSWNFSTNRTKTANVNLDYGTYTATAYVIDTAGNYNSTETRNFTIRADIISPLISFVAPTFDNATSTSNTTAVINVSIIETNISIFTWNWNGTNYIFHNNSVVLFYNFENATSLGETNSKVIDSSKYTSNGTILGNASLTTSGKYGGGIVFNGTHGFMGVGAPVSLNINGPMSIELWTNMANTVNSWSRLIQKGHTSQYGYGIGTGDTATAQKLIGWYKIPGGNEYTQTTSLNLNPAQWYHIVMTYDGNGGVLMYVNGTNASTTSAGGDTSWGTGGNNLDFGRKDGTNSNYYNGTIDEVRIYNYTLSPAEVWQHYLSNLKHFNSTEWSFSTNQTKNLTTGLDLGTYTYSATVTDIGDNTNQTETRYLTIAASVSNTAPMLNIPSITPNPAYANDTLSTNVTYIDNESNLGTVYFLWYNASGNIFNQTNSSVGNGSIVMALLSSGNFTRNATINVSVWANDSTLNSTTVWSGSITIQNSLPAVSNVILNSTSDKNATSGNLTLYFSVSDVNGDAVKNITNWYRNGNSITVLNMPFEGGSNSTWTKDYALGNNGTAYTTFWNSTRGYDGYGAYQFNGSSDYIENNIQLVSDYPFTLAAWIRTNVSTNQAIISLADKDGATLYKMGIGSNGGITAAAYYNSSLYQDGGAGSGYNDDNWHFFAVAFTTSTLRTYYVDGASRGTQTTNIPYNFSVDRFSIGRNGDSTPDQYFNGTIDDVLIFNRSLSAQEIQALYNNRTYLIVSQELSQGNVWQACVTPNDGNYDGTQLCSNNLTINTAPTHTTPILNATNNNNNTNQNLTVYPQTVADVNGDAVKNITNWYRNGNSITVLNMPFEGGSTSTWTKDYALGNNASSAGSASPTWNATGGHDGFGAYIFNGVNNRLNISTTRSVEVVNNFTVAMWLYDKSTNYDRMLEKGDSYFFLDGYSAVPNTNCDGGKSYGNFTFLVKVSNVVYCAVDVGPHTQNRWYFLVGIKNQTDLAIFVDGRYKNSVSLVGNIDNDQLPLMIGSDDTTFYFNGIIDDVMIFNRSLSPQEIFALNSSRTDLIVSQELSQGDVWQACVTPNDGNYDGTKLCSNNLTILASNSRPPAPILLSLANGTNTTVRTPTFAWNNSVDPDTGDLVTYNLLIDDNSAFNNPEVNVSGITNNTLLNTSYNISAELAVDTQYYWKVAANDTSGYGDFSNVFNFTLQSYLAVSLPVNTVSFGTLNNSQWANTTTGNPPPFWVENVGNIFVNVSVTATPMFTSVAYPSEYYQFRIEANESGAFNTTISSINWTNMTNVTGTINVFDWDWHSIKNDFLTGLSVLVPAQEGAGTKSSTVTFTVSSP